MKLYRYVCVFVFSFAMGSVPLWAANPLQQLIDDARSGDIVEVPAGVYQGAIHLKQGVILRGAGAEHTIIDGLGESIAVKGAKDAVLMGVTVVNAQVGVHNQHSFMGVFETDVSGCARACIVVEKGSSVIANNDLRGNQKSMGVSAVESNPYIGHNVITEHAIGISIWNRYIPTVMHNRLINNKIAIRVGGEASTVLGNNIISGGTAVRGASLSSSDVVRNVAPGEETVFRGGTLEGYLGLMDIVRERSIAMHPVVIYDLEHPVGTFGVVTLFPWDSFTVASSTKDTIIFDYDAYDAHTLARLRSEYHINHLGNPAVKVSAEGECEPGHERYVLEKMYDHPNSYNATEAGGFRFRRTTNFSRMEIVLPPGMKVTVVNLPHRIEDFEGQQVVKIEDIGYTQIDISMQPSSTE